LVALEANAAASAAVGTVGWATSSREQQQQTNVLKGPTNGATWRCMNNVQTKTQSKQESKTHDNTQGQHQDSVNNSEAAQGA